MCLSIITPLTPCSLTTCSKTLHFACGDVSTSGLPAATEITARVRRRNRYTLLPPARVCIFRTPSEHTTCYRAGPENRYALDGGRAQKRSAENVRPIPYTPGMGRARSQQDHYPEGLTAAAALGRNWEFLYGSARLHYLRLGQDYLDYVRDLEVGRSWDEVGENFRGTIARDIRTRRPPPPPG